MRPSWAILASGAACVALAAACDDETETSATGAPTGTETGTATGTATGTDTGTATASGAGTTPGGQGTGGSGQGGSTSQGGGSSQGGQGSGGCISCTDVWNNDADPADLCDDGDPSELDLYEAVKSCACDGTCSQCANSLCQDSNPSGSCQGCVSSSCNDEFNACVGL